MQWRKPTLWFNSYLIASPNRIDLPLASCSFGLAVQLCLSVSVGVTAWQVCIWLFSPRHIIFKLNYGLFPARISHFSHPFVLFLSCPKDFAASSWRKIYEAFFCPFFSLGFINTLYFQTFLRYLVKWVPRVLLSWYFKEKYFLCEGDPSSEQVAQRCFGICFLGERQNWADREPGASW